MPAHADAGARLLARRPRRLKTRRIASETSTPAAGRPVRLVTVDDQPHFHAAAEAIVASTPGFELVGESADGPAALRDVRELDPDMIIVDVRMDGMDGMEVAQRLREQDATRVIVLATTVETGELSELAQACGAAALVRKHWLTPRMLRGLWIAHRRR